MAEAGVSAEIPQVRDVALLKVHPGMETTAEGLFQAIKKANQKALVLLGYASGATPTILDPLIREFTEQGISVFVLSNNPGENKGIQTIKYGPQRDSITAGAIPLSNVNVNNAEEVLLTIQAEIDEGKTGRELNEAVIAKFGTPMPTK